MRENIWLGTWRRLLQECARIGPGATTLRVRLHRWRGVEIGRNVWIGYGAVIETANPHLVHIGNNVSIGIRATIIAHFRDSRGVWIEDDVFVGPCVCILPSVRLGKGCVVTAGSVVTTNVASMTVVQGNPARAVAKCRRPLLVDTSMNDFLRGLIPIRQR
jgi:acetyltransferase-like isoleucine patch superfamily enzyme